MLDFIIVSSLFSWMTHCVLLHNVKTRLHNKGYRYGKDPRSLSERAASGVKEFVKHTFPGYNIFNSLRKIFNAEETKQQMERELIESGRVVKAVPRLIKLNNGQYMTGEELLRRQEMLKNANNNQKQTAYNAPRPVVVRTTKPVAAKPVTTRPVAKPVARQTMVKPVVKTNTSNNNKTQFLEAERRILLNQFGEQAYYGTTEKNYTKRR